MNDPNLPRRKLCTDCGVSRSSNPARCGTACQFINPNYTRLELQVHGRTRDSDLHDDERFFGPYQRMYQAALRNPQNGSQWTGITTRIAESLLESNLIDAVLTVRADEKDQWKPVPTLVTNKVDLVACRGMRMGYSPLLSLLEEAAERGYRRLAVIGIPCQIYALRSLQSQLGLEQLYVIGTPCSDNTSTENFHHFLSLLSDRPQDINFLEFMPDYHVEIRFTDGEKQSIPFLQLPISSLPKDFFPVTCRTCVDYSNSLADITVGYMGGSGQQWVLVRNGVGQKLFDLIAEELVISEPQSAGKRESSVKGFIGNLERSAGGLPLRRMPQWARGIVSWIMPRFGPRGLEFARTRIEMKAAEAVIVLRAELPKRVRDMLPQHVWDLVRPYGLKKTQDEQSRHSDVKIPSAADKRA